MPERRPTSTQTKKPKPEVRRLKEWDSSNVPEAKFFDKTADKDYMRKKAQRPSTAKANTDLPFSVEKDRETGKSLFVKYVNKGGREGQSLQIYHDIDKLNQDMATGFQPSSYSIKDNQTAVAKKKGRSPPKSEPAEPLRGHGTVEIAGVALEQNDLKKLNSLLERQDQKDSSIPGEDLSAGNLAVQ